MRSRDACGSRTDQIGRKRWREVALSECSDSRGLGDLADESSNQTHGGRGGDALPTIGFRHADWSVHLPKGPLELSRRDST